MMGPNWYEKAVEQLEDDYAAGRIDYGTYHNELRELNRDLDAAAEEAARDAYDNYHGGW